MLTLRDQILFCIPIGLGVAFMLWVLLAFWREEHSRKAQKQRVVDGGQPLIIHHAGSRFVPNRTTGVLQTAGQWQRSSGSQ
jgi:hypothetical protein